MFGIPTFDLLTDSGKQGFVEYVVNLMRNEIVSYTSSYINSATNVTVDLTPYATIAMLNAHASDTTNIHGIVDTSVLATQTDVSTAVSTHSSDTTSVHGISDTANLVYTNDSRLSDSRTPTGGAGGVLSGSYPNPGFAVDMATQSELDNHASDTTSVHGIADTSVLATSTDVSTAVSTHAAVTTSVHGISNTANLVYTNDSRLSDARTPTGAAGGVLSGTYPNPVFATTPVPIGALMPFAGSTAPTGWLLCAGQTLDSITTPDYAALFAVIGTTYGGTGASNFMIPDLRGRTVAGKDNMNGTTASRITSTSGIVGTTLGAAGGNERIQDHTHTFSGTTGNDSPDHYHYYEDTTWMEGTYANWGWRGSNTGWDSDNSPVGFQWGRNTNGASARHQHGYSGTTANHNQTSGGASQNMPPTIILNYIIKF